MVESTRWELVTDSDDGSGFELPVAGQDTAIRLDLGQDRRFGRRFDPRRRRFLDAIRF